MKKLHCTLLLLPFFSLACLHGQKFSWAFSVGDTLEQTTRDIATDKSGNVVIGGVFASVNSIDFDPSSSGNVSLTSAGSEDCFVAKYDKYGEYLWAFSIGSTDNDGVEKLTVDDSGNIYVSGWFKLTVDFDPSPTGTAIYTSKGGTGLFYGGDAFLAKYSAAGQFMWVITVGSSGVYDSGNDVQIDKDGNLLWTGLYQGTVDFDPSSNLANLYASNVGIYLAKYTPSGGYLWAVSFDTYSTNNGGRMIKTDKQGNIYLTGLFENNIDLNPNPTGTNFFSAKGNIDIFLVKLDSSANYLWGKTMGGNNGDYPWTMDIDDSSNLYLTGYFSSTNLDIDPGPAVQNLSSVGGFDIFIAKYDKYGNYIFANSFGSTGNDWGFDIYLNPNGYTIMGNYMGNVDFDPGTGVNTLFGSGGFVARYDFNGNFKNCFKLGGTARCMSVTYDTLSGGVFKENNYISGYFSSWNEDFDPSSLKHLLTSRGANDVFLSKLSELELSNTIQGEVFFDYNFNGIRDASDRYARFAKVISIKPNYDTIVSITPNGRFGYAVDTGTYVSTTIPFRSYYNLVPLSHTSNFTTYKNVDSVNFAFRPLPDIKDLSIQLFPIQRARPGFSTSYILVYQNNGTVPITNATIELVLDSRLTFASSSPSPLTVAGDTLKWTLSNLIPDSIGLITIVFGIPASPSVNIGDTLSSVATIYPTVGDSTPVDNTVQLHQRVLGSFDPNDKSEIHGGAITTSKVAEGEYLQYTIRFQNTGTDTAFRIIIEDTLSDKLDWSTLQMVSASHDYKLTISGGKNCKWNFVNIKLVDSMENAALSHGYVVYRIKPKANLVIGNVIRNTAFIYFDYNPPIKTNTEVTTVTQSALPLKLQIFSARKSGTKNLLEWTTSNEDDVEYFEVQRSMEGRDFKAIGKVLAKGMSIVQHYFFTDYEPLKTVNFYRLKMIDRDGNFTFSPIRKINSQLVFDVNVYPNPVKNNLYIYTTCEWSTNVIIDIVNAEGKIVMQQKMTLAEGADVKTLNIASLATGNYFIKFRNGNELISVKFQKL